MKKMAVITDPLNEEQEMQNAAYALTIVFLRCLFVAQSEDPIKQS